MALQIVSPGDRISASQWNEIVRILNSLSKLQGDGYVKIVGNVIGLNLDMVKQLMNRFGPTNNPSTLGANTEGSETANAATWKREGTTSGTNYAGTPLDLWFVSDVVYNHAGDKILYAMKRKASYDLIGHLYEVSAETRISVDATEAGTCS